MSLTFHQNIKNGIQKMCCITGLSLTNTHCTGSSGFCRSDKSNSGSSQCTEEEEVPMPVQEMCGTDEKLEDVWEKSREKTTDASVDWVLTLMQTCCCHLRKRNSALRRPIWRFCDNDCPSWETLRLREIWVAAAHKDTLDIQHRANLFQQIKVLFSARLFVFIPG